MDEVSLAKMRAQLAKALRPRRYVHSVGVEQEARRLASRFGADAELCATAGLLHDCARDIPGHQLVEIVSQHDEGCVSDALLRNPVLLHGLVGAILAKEKYGIDDERVLRAIRLHTMGAPDMTPEDKVVCLADYTEPGRDFPGVEGIRACAERSLDLALLAAFDSTIKHLIDSGYEIEAATVAARNGILRGLENSTGVGDRSALQQ